MTRKFLTADLSFAHEGTHLQTKTCLISIVQSGTRRSQESFATTTVKSAVELGTEGDILLTVLLRW